MAKTISDLDINASEAFAATERLRAETQAASQEAVAISKSAQVDVTSPTFLGEFELLFQEWREKVSWALFQPPAGYLSQSMGRLFTDQISPSLSTSPKQDMQKQRLEAFENKKNDEQVDHEKRILLAAFNEVASINENQIAIYLFKSQYYKG